MVFAEPDDPVEVDPLPTLKSSSSIHRDEVVVRQFAQPSTLVMSVAITEAKVSES